MVRNQEAAAARPDTKTFQHARRRRNACRQRREVLFLSDAFDMSPGADWHTISERVSRGQPIRGVCV
jgi:hypothetical protein